MKRTRQYPPFFTLKFSDPNIKPTAEQQIWLNDMAWKMINSSPELKRRQREFDDIMEAGFK